MSVNIGVKRALGVKTIVPLGNAGVFTSPLMDALNYKFYSYRSLSDQAGSIQIQQSDDGSTNSWENLIVAAATTAATAAIVNAIPITLRYIRAVYTNGSTPQGSFTFSLYLLPL